LLKGPHFQTEVVRYEKGKARRIRGEEKYEITN